MGVDTGNAKSRHRDPLRYQRVHGEAPHQQHLQQNRLRLATRTGHFHPASRHHIDTVKGGGVEEHTFKRLLTIPDLTSFTQQPSTWLGSRTNTEAPLDG